MRTPSAKYYQHIERGYWLRVYPPVNPDTQRRQALRFGPWSRYWCTVTAERLAAEFRRVKRDLVPREVRA